MVHLSHTWKQSVTLLLFAIVSCSKSNIDKQNTTEPFTDVVSFESNIGGEDLPDEYLLMNPFFRSLEVNSDGEILVADENWIKVYNPDGQPITRFGGEGDGPGEFRRGRDLYLSPNGYLTVFGGQFGFTAHYFRPDYSYIERVNYMSTQPFKHILETAGMRADRPEIVYCLGEEERLYIIGAQDVDRENREHREVYLYYETADSLHVLAHHAQTDGIIGGGIYMSSLGKLLVSPLPGNRCVFLHTYFDSQHGPDDYTYTLTILDLESFERSEITHTYTPEEFVWEPFDYSEEYKQQRPDQWKQMQERNANALRTFKEREYSVPIIQLVTDNQFIFAFTATNNDSLGVLVDVFDSEVEEYICSAYFPAAYGVQIANMYLYKFNEYRLEGDIPLVEKYRIDPKVYGKR